jgi:hypothetical protein
MITFNRLLSKASFVLGFFFTFKKNVSMPNVNIWVEYFNMILELFPFINWDQ